MTQQASDPPGLIKIRAASYREALARINAEYGKKVRIVHTRHVKRDGLIGMVGGKGVEIYITTQEGDLLPDSLQNFGLGEASASASHIPDSKEHESKEQVADAIGGQLRKLLSDQKLRDNRAREGVSPRVDRSALNATLRQGTIEETLAALNSRVQKEAEIVRTPIAPAASKNLQNIGMVKPGHPIMRAACQLLKANSFSAEGSNDLLTRLRSQSLPTVEPDTGEAETMARLLLGDLLRPRLAPCSPISVERRNSPGPRLIACIGPTGVGKTTTIAKLAVPLHLVHKYSVGLITLDTFRIGALEQIQRYGDIVGLPVRAVAPGERLSDAVEELSDCDFIFIDSAGCGQRKNESLAELKDQFATLADIEVHLCLPLNASSDYLCDVAKRFEAVGYHRILLTKSDEAVSCGSLLEVVQGSKVPVSYVTFGQNVPEDIEAASTQRIEELLLGRKS